MQQGIVKRFVEGEGKNFGFLEAATGEEVFFHWSYGGVMVCDGGNEPVFERGLGDDDRKPIKGEVIYFVPEKGPKGQRAARWCLGESIPIALAEIAERAVYRLRERKGNRKTKLYSGSQEKYTTLWEGRDLRELRALHPLVLKPTHCDSYQELFFEKVVDGEWQRCDDPR